MRFRGAAATLRESGSAARRPALDGVRALSMGAVLLYHADLSTVPGGFLGISTFFTLSGFLITTLLLREHDRDGGLDIPAFLARRYRRLLPAAYLALGGVLLFGATVATEQQLDDLPGAVASAIGQVANWFFVLSGRSYVDLFTQPSPLQHFWSLAIEEQFYLALPLLLLGVLRLTRSTRVLAALLGGSILASTAAMAVLFERGASIDRLYYGTDTRAAELLVGSLLALVVLRRPGVIDGVVRRVAPVLGLGCLAVLTWAWMSVELTDARLYRGGFLVVALATAGLIASLLAERGPVAALVGSPPVAAFGRVTYGVYLYHWPIFLWLTEERTDLSPGPLLLLRLVTTGAAAALSYHLVEMPIRERRWPAISRRLHWAVAPTAATLLVGVTLVGARDVHTDLAGLEQASSPMPSVPAVDEVLDVLVIADWAAQDVPTGLAAHTAGAADVRVVVAPPLGCGPDRARKAPSCSSWSEEWPELIREHDPDVVLLHATHWDPVDLERRSGTSDDSAQTEWLVQALDRGLDVLTANGARVVWGQDVFDDMADGERRGTEPFHRAMTRLTTTRSDLRVSVGRAPDQLLADLTTYRRRGEGAARVMIVGDSTARTLGYGLERWAEGRSDVVVWSAATFGCGFADEGATLDPADRLEPVPAHCRRVADDLHRAVDEYRPDRVVVLSHIFDLQRRRLDGWTSTLGPGDPAFDDYLLSEYLETYDLLAARGAEVIWLDDPCVLPGLAGSGKSPAFQPDRIRHVNDVVLRRLAEARPALERFDLFTVLCPMGSFSRELGGVPDVRPDGAHFSPEGARWLADAHAAEILGLDTGPVLAVSGG